MPEGGVPGRVAVAEPRIWALGENPAERVQPLPARKGAGVRLAGGEIELARLPVATPRRLFAERLCGGDGDDRAATATTDDPSLRGELRIGSNHAVPRDAKLGCQHPRRRQSSPLVQTARADRIAQRSFESDALPT